ncbi:heparinase II/III domain-containing protein [Zobellella iuensis]|uniref:Heparinase II/III family protein n=1 Tax=Zobellella iuensis TaxID=2803811 RepID=A0ABS1QTG7_9GAMM|nr:heparinase II/III family protein [Zobellella iuensis]MBL1377761.1 heparinase II/III family protein [Zobellella iuensis]
MLPYEDLSNVDIEKSIIAANNTLTIGWSRRGYDRIFINQIPWELKDPKERSWNFLIHCWDMLDSLFKAYQETQNELYIRNCLSVALDWTNYVHSTPQHSISPMVWYDMAVGIRSYRLAYLIDVLSEKKLVSEDILASLWDVLEQHRLYLENDENIIFHNNHGLYQAAGQIAMGRRFCQKSVNMEKAYTQGKKRLRFMLMQQFCTDGIHKEHSPDYHRMVYETIKALIDAGLVDDQETIIFSRVIEESLSWFILPDQHITNFGDSDYRLMSRKPDEAIRKWNTPEMQYVVSGGMIGKKPSKSSSNFSEGGYYVVKSPSKYNPDSFSQTSYLAQIAAFHSRAHKHADDLSFIWSDRGFNLLVDAGRYGYIGKAEQGSELWLDGYWYSDVNRVYCESTRAHNTLEFNDKNFPRKTAKPYGSAIRRVIELEQDIYAIETECKHFKSIRHARLIIYKPAQWLLVFDWFHDNANETHQVKQWFHIDKKLQANICENGYTIPLSPHSEPLQIASLLKGPTPSKIYIGEEDPIMQGWWSGQEREIEENPAFYFELENAATGNFATLFTFSNLLHPDKQWSKSNTSGRKGQFRWIDECGTHELYFERPKSGNISIDYKLTNLTEKNITLFQNDQLNDLSKKITRISSHPPSSMDLLLRLYVSCTRKKPNLVVVLGGGLPVLSIATALKTNNFGKLISFSRSENEELTTREMLLSEDLSSWVESHLLKPAPKNIDIKKNKEDHFELTVNSTLKNEPKVDIILLDTPYCINIKENLNSFIKNLTSGSQIWVRKFINQDELDGFRTLLKHYKFDFTCSNLESEGCIFVLESGKTSLTETKNRKAKFNFSIDDKYQG